MTLPNCLNKVNNFLFRTIEVHKNYEKVTHKRIFDAIRIGNVNYAINCNSRAAAVVSINRIKIILFVEIQKPIGRPIPINYGSSNSRCQSYQTNEIVRCEICNSKANIIHKIIRSRVC